MLLDPLPAPAGVAALPAFVRARGRLAAGFSATGRGTQVMTLHEAGGYRMKFPRVGHCEAVMINTGGGLAGGDELAVDIGVGAGASVVLTTQSAEKVYRADSHASRVAVVAHCEAGARLSWLPQETILFSGARLSRRLTVEMAEDATLTLAESVVFGRLAMGEVAGAGLLEDRWMLRRGGRLVLAEAVRLDGPMAGLLDRPALGGGARAVSTVVHVAPRAEALLGPVREALQDGGSDAGASAWNGMLVARFAAADPALLRRDVAAVLARIEDRALPRVWQC